MILTIVFLILGAFVAFALYDIGYRELKRARRREFIRTYMFPIGLMEKLQKHHPQIGQKEYQLIARALRHFFLGHLNTDRGYVSMPSQVVDDLWHEFILHTKAYDDFCRKAFGRFFHHSPVSTPGVAQAANEGLARTWRQVCIEENINPRKPTRLPLLFSLDKKLAITAGYIYALDCNTLVKDGSAVIHCGSDLASTKVSGSNGTAPGGSGGCSGHGCSGHGCSGGCGGGCGGD